MNFLQPLASFLQILKPLQLRQTHLVVPCLLTNSNCWSWGREQSLQYLQCSGHLCATNFNCKKSLVIHPWNYFSLFISVTHNHLLSWFYHGNTTKSAKHLDDLGQQVLLAEDFNHEELQNFHAAQELKKLDDHMNQPSNLLAEDGWIEGSIKFHLPCTRVKVKTEEEAPEFLVDPVYYHHLTQVLISFQKPAAKLFHYIPFKLFWKLTADFPPKRILSEIYNSDAMIT